MAATENPFEVLDALDGKALFEIVKKHGITHVYHLAAMLSATGEQNPMFAWKLNMESLFHVLDLGKENTLNKFTGQVLLQYLVQPHPARTRTVHGYGAIYHLRHKQTSRRTLVRMVL